MSAQLQHQRLRVFPALKLAGRIAVASGSALAYCGFGNECAKPWHLPLVWPVQRRVVDLVQLPRHLALLSRRLRQGARPAEPMLQRGSWPKKRTWRWSADASWEVRDNCAQGSATWLSAADPWPCPNAECVASKKLNYGHRKVCCKCGVWNPCHSISTSEP